MTLHHHQDINKAALPQYPIDQDQIEHVYFKNHPDSKPCRLVEFESGNRVVVTYIQNSKNPNNLGWELKFQVPAENLDHPNQHFSIRGKKLEVKGKLEEQRVIDNTQLARWMKSHDLSKADYFKVSEAIDSIIEE